MKEFIFFVKNSKCYINTLEYVLTINTDTQIVNLALGANVCVREYKQYICVCEKIKCVCLCEYI